MPWISDRFVQLLIRPNHPNTIADFYENAETDNFVLPGYFCPFLGWHRMNQTIARFNDFSDFITYQIQQGYYLEASLDRYYFSFYHHYHLSHFIHLTFIYGYDDEERCVYISDFFDSGKYVRKKVSFDEINKSIEGIDYYINLYKVEDFSYEINLEQLKTFISDYLSEMNSINKFQFSYQPMNRNIIYGLGFYSHILDEFMKKEYLDIRPFHILYDHKVINKIRIDYLTETCIFDNDKSRTLHQLNEQIMEDTCFMRNMAIKYNITHNLALKRKIEEKCKVIKEADRHLFTQMLYALP
jgi:hypothetical protein